MVPHDSAMRLGAARAVVAAYTEPGGIATISSVAQRTGFSEAMVREIMASPEWDELVGQSILQIVAPVVTRGIKRIAEIIDDPESPPNVMLSAHRAAMTTYDIVMRHRTAQTVHDKDEALEALLAKLPTANAIVKNQPDIHENIALDSS